MEDEVDEFFAILRRLREVMKYFEKGRGEGKVSDPSGKVVEGEVCVKKRKEMVVLDLNTDLNCSNRSVDTVREKRERSGRRSRRSSGRRSRRRDR
ncbi:hypothetical protein Hanom_Chr10g00906881 [Helianthus anomalus]